MIGRGWSYLHWIKEIIERFRGKSGTFFYGRRVSGKFTRFDEVGTQWGKWGNMQPAVRGLNLCRMQLRDQ